MSSYIVYSNTDGKRRMVLVTLQDSRWVAVATKDPSKATEAIERSRFNKVCATADPELLESVNKAFTEAEEISVKVDRKFILKSIAAIKKL